MYPDLCVAVRRGPYNILHPDIEQTARSKGPPIIAKVQAGHDCCGQYWMHGAACRWYVRSRGATVELLDCDGVRGQD